MSNKMSTVEFMCLVLIFLSGFLFGKLAHADPAWCDVGYFQSHELKTNAPHTVRLRSFKIGKLTLNGLAVGESDVNEVAGFSAAPKSRNFCTWYFANTAKPAEASFNWDPVVLPLFGWIPFSSNIIADHFARDIEPQVQAMVSCMEDYHYWAGGCNAQRHRGPSAFAWLLSMSGCSPVNASRVANSLWGLNGVPSWTREEIAERGFRFGSVNPLVRSRMQKVMSE